MKEKVTPNSLSEQEWAEEFLSAEIQPESELDGCDSRSPTGRKPRNLSVKRSASLSFILVPRRPLRPRFNSTDLLDELREVHSAYKAKSLTDYSEDLLRLTEQWKTVFQDQKPVLAVIRQYHVLVRLKAFGSADTAEQDEIAEYKAVVLGEEKRVDSQYCVLQAALQLVNALAVKFKFANLNDFHYRLTNCVMNLTVLDLNAMNEDFYTMDTLWFALMKEEPPIKQQLSVGAQSFAEVLTGITTELFSKLILLNWPSTQEVIIRTGSAPDEAQLAESVVAQSLTVRSRLLRCFKSNAVEEQVLELKQTLANFHAAYRQFEKELLSSFL